MNTLGSTLVIFVISFMSCTNSMGLNDYAGYKEPCLVGGPEKYVKQYKYHKEVYWGNFTERWNGILCNTSEYLLCYNVDESNPKSEGICDCNNQHSLGYILVYDAATEVQECRGYINSSCGRTMECHTGLECEIGKGCQCPSSGCPTIPLPRSYSPNYVHSNGLNHQANYITIALILTRSSYSAIIW